MLETTIGQEFCVSLPANSNYSQTHRNMHTECKTQDVTGPRVYICTLYTMHMTYRPVQPWDGGKEWGGRGGLFLVSPE